MLHILELLSFSKFLLDESEARGMKMDKKEATKEKEMAKWRNGEMKY